VWMLDECAGAMRLLSRQLEKQTDWQTATLAERGSVGRG
jgi:hypothetical protein